MQILKEKIVRYETDGSIVKAYDAGELVRCKDCKLCEVYYHGPEAPEMFTHFCKRNGRHVEGNEFCSRAERKEE